jgi:hypothetical protein
MHIGSMWVKIYAAMSGTPTYDSRVAGAIATIVETWRIESGRENEPLRMELTFPAVQDHAERHVRRRYEHATNPGTLWYRTTERRAGATVRLGWLLQELHRGKQHWCLAHSLEWALRMAGYDCQQINTPPQAAARVGHSLHLHA